MLLKVSRWYNILFLILALLTLGTFYPFVYNYVLFGNYKSVISLFALLVWILALLIYREGKLTLPNKSFNYIISIQIIFLFVWSVFLSSISIRMQIIQLILGWIVTFLFINSFQSKYILKTFIKLNITSLILCIIGLFLVINQVIGLHSTVKYQGDFQIYNYIFFFIKRTEETSLNLRVAGYYDEPGSFAYIVMFLLLLNRKYFMNKTYEYALLFLPIVTTSLAHIVTALVYLTLFYFKEKVLRNIIFACVSLLLIFLLLNNIKETAYGTYFWERTLGRIESIYNGDDDRSRSGGLELGPQIFFSNPLGTAPEVVEKKYPAFVTETFWSPLIFYGILGFPIYYLLILYPWMKQFERFSKQEVFILIIVSLNLLQRPSYLYPIYIVLLYYLFYNRIECQEKPKVTRRVRASQIKRKITYFYKASL